MSYSLNPYSGSWTSAEAGHLLRRALYGPTYAQLQDAVTNGIDATVDDLLVLTLAPNPPLSYHPKENVAAFGTSWVTSVYSTPLGKIDAARERSLDAWLIQNNFELNSTITQKMIMFWHNHFAVEDTKDSRANYNYYELLRTHALGNFKTLVKEMTIDPAMLVFLNGKDNVASDPNENYARELLELYSIGKGHEIGNDDFSTYTEVDVTEGARILTGYSIEGWRSTVITSPYAIFTEADHDMGSKTLSYHFNAATISPNGQTEYEDYIDVIFAQPDFANFICESIYHFFVNNDITNGVKTQVIPEMAKTLTNNNFEILPVMKQLLKSEHFYDAALRGCLIKSPMDYVIGIYNSTDSKANFDVESDYRLYYNVYKELRDILGMNLSGPPSVAGWPAYYEAPNFSRLWVGAVHLKGRSQFIDTRIASGSFSASTGKSLVVDFVGLLNSLPNPSNANSVIDALEELYMPTPLNNTDKLALKNILTDDLPNFEWTDLYNNYLLDPTANYTQVRNQMRATLGALYKLYMFHTF
ncbi:DUF1800 domain-containing protein [Tamlana sp. 2201CG12-4]|uniref:DUF1800 domain-containing protein n=1 Tax=Tamlana sp. 2201CG12-4 TaxID=3112582 RepID=UPI002DBC51B5|nr:DUF1800 domain-containing protein [Tamlana sp. 2201CG12-4]MEC3907262.1 DUF1800 domain-containing protein [Tamlana sp. 2201CG12-4]